MRRRTQTATGYPFKFASKRLAHSMELQRCRFHSCGLLRKLHGIPCLRRAFLDMVVIFKLAFHIFTQATQDPWPATRFLRYSRHLYDLYVRRRTQTAMGCPFLCSSRRIARRKELRRLRLHGCMWSCKLQRIPGMRRAFRDTVITLKI